MKTFLDSEKEAVQIYFKKHGNKQVNIHRSGSVSSTLIMSKSWKSEDTMLHQKVCNECYLLFPIDVLASVLFHDNNKHADNLETLIRDVFSKLLPLYVYNINYTFGMSNNYYVVHMAISVKFNDIKNDDVPLSDEMFVKFLHGLRDRFIDHLYGSWHLA